MYARHPEIARRWRAEYGAQTQLPERKGDFASRLRPRRRRRRRPKRRGRRRVGFHRMPSGEMMPNSQMRGY